jgi:hypothetical protein
MKIYGQRDDIIIPLDKCTTMLNTEKRRVYDIMNIFEGFGAVSRKAKNLYTWKGLKKINSAFENILERCRAITQNFSCRFSQNEGECEDHALAAYKFDRVKSLGFLCESFICLFLLWKPVITLEEAATKISKILLNESKLKTKVRRLYDIANVLWVLKVIKKTLLTNGKPAFEWVGQSGMRDFSMEIENDASSTRESIQKSLIPIPLNEAEIRHNIGFDHCKLNLCKRSERNNKHFNGEWTQNFATVQTLESVVGSIPNGIYENSLDLLEGIVKVLKKRLNSGPETTPKNFNK